MSRVSVVQRHVIVGAADHRRAFEHLLRRTLGVDGQAAVLALVDRRHQTQRRVEPEQPPPLVLAARNGDVDAELAHRFEHPHLGRFAARLSRPLRRELGARAGGGGTAEEAEDRIGRDRRRGRSVALEVDLAERRPDARRAHPVLGQGAGLVGADHGRRAERLDRREPLDERALSGELGHPDGECERDRRQKPLGDVGDDQTDREAGGVVEGEAGDEPADRQKGKPRGDGDDGDQPGDAPHLQLERARLRLDPFRERGDPPELGLHPGCVDERGRLTRDDRGAAEDQVTRLEQLPAPRLVSRGAQHRLRLARQRREVDVERPFDQPRVRGDSLALLDEQYVAGHELGRMHERTLAVPANRGLLRQVRTQRLDRALGLALLRKGESGVEDDHRQHR